MRLRYCGYFCDYPASYRTARSSELGQRTRASNRDADNNNNNNNYDSGCEWRSTNDEWRGDILERTDGCCWWKPNDARTLASECLFMPLTAAIDLMTLILGIVHYWAIDKPANCVARARSGNCHSRMWRAVRLQSICPASCQSNVKIVSQLTF